MSPRGVRIGITGGIACGKSEVGRALRRRGVPVLDADRVARDVLRPGRPAYRAVVRRFGRSILRRDGTIDRAALGRIVFDNDAERAALNARVHPAVLRAVGVWLADATRRRLAAAVIVPLLFETGSESMFDVVVCVGAPRREVLRRLRARGLTSRDADRRICALQLDPHAVPELARKRERLLRRQIDHEPALRAGALDALRQRRQTLGREASGGDGGRPRLPEAPRLGGARRRWTARPFLRIPDRARPPGRLRTR